MASRFESSITPTATETEYSANVCRSILAVSNEEEQMQTGARHPRVPKIHAMRVHFEYIPSVFGTVSFYSLHRHC